MPDKLSAAKCSADAPKEGVTHNLDYANEISLQTFFIWKNTFWETTKWHMQEKSSSVKDLPDAFKIRTLKHFLTYITLRARCELTVMKENM